MYNVLIVDDEKIEREGLKFLIKKYKSELNVLEAGNGEIALDCLKKSMVDIVITDIKMPFMGGIELIEKIRECNEKIEIVLLSAYEEFEYAREALKYNVAHYLLKPVPVDEFLEVINKVIKVCEEERIKEQVLELKFFSNSSTVLFTTHDSSRESSYSVIDGVLKDIRQSIDLKEFQVAKNSIELLFKAFTENGNLSTIYIKYIFIEIVKYIFESSGKPDDSHMQNLAEKIYNTHNLLELRTLLISFIEENENKETLESTKSKAIEKIIDYIKENYMEDISLEDLSNRVFLSPSYLSHLFKQETGESIVKFITSYRLRKACELLRSTNMKIIDICNNVGYSNLSYFCLIFKKFYGMSPTKYREMR